MDRRRIAFIVLLLAILMLSGCVVRFTSGSAPKSSSNDATRKYQQAKAVADGAFEVYKKAKSSSGAEAAAEETKQWLEQRDDVEATTIGTGCIWFKCKNGIEYVIQTDRITGQ
jgi:PBP1b-binding outer membrane lipoprotein LpoB